MIRRTLIVIALLAPASAEAAPRMETVSIGFGFMVEAIGTGCAPAVVTRAVVPGVAAQLTPAVGAEVGDSDSVVVTDASVQGAGARWTVHPTPADCEVHASEPAWTWRTGLKPWSVTQPAQRFAIRATKDQLRSIAGFRVDRFTNGAPTVAQVRRYFGTPSSVKRRFGVSCRLHWKRTGLTIDFVHRGRHPCRHGFLNSGRVEGAAGERWAAVVDGAPGTETGTEVAFLKAEGRGKAGRSRRWTFAESFIPYGTGRYVPSLSAIVSTGRVGGFEFWVGGGED